MNSTSLLQAAGFVEPKVMDAQELWDLVEVKSRDLFAVPHVVLIFKAKATWAAVDAAKARIAGAVAKRPLHAVVQRSCSSLVGNRWSENRERIKKSLAAADVFTNQELLGQATRRSLRTLVQHEAEANFIEPNLQTGGLEPTPAIDYLTKWLGGEVDPSQPRIAVLVAPAGVGKTTVARQLSQSLKSSNSGLRIPLLVDPDHWATLPSANLGLWDIWKQAFEYNYDHVVTEDDFAAFVENGCLVPVLDGLDELCTRRAHDFEPAVTLESIQALAEDVDARVVLTTRDAFWASVPEEVRRSTLELQLQPFNGQQVDRYIEKRFAVPSTQPQRAAAKRIISRLQTAAFPTSGQRLPPYQSRLWSLPLVVYLVCESADSDRIEDTEKPFGALLEQKPLAAILLMLCERERLRRQLQMVADDQMKLLRTLAVDYGHVFLDRDLDELCEIDFPHLPPEQRQLLRSHALVHPLDAERYAFRFDFMRDYLRAEAVRDLLGKEIDGKAARLLVQLLAPEASGRTAALEHLLRVWEDTDWKARLRSVWEALPDARTDSGGLRAQDIRRAKSAVVQTGIRLAEDAADEKSDRTALLQEVFGDGWTRDFYFEGPLAGLDLSRIRFEGCEFFNSGFRNCTFSAFAAFERCRFRGTFDSWNCDDFASATLEDDCTYSTDAREFFVNLRGAERTPIDRGHVVDLLAEILKRFRSHGRFKTVTESDALRGPAGRSKIGHDLLDELLKVGVVYRHTISGVGKDAGLAVSKASMPEVQAFLDNRVLGSGLTPVANRICEKWCRRK